MKKRDSSAAIDTDAPFCREFRVSQDAIDQNGHVNNVVYIQWMQDVAVHHSEACGGTAAIQKMGCSWIVRSHKIDYLSPAYADEHIVAFTWVVDFRKVRSLRKYLFLRKEDGKVLARGETDWVFVHSVSGRPCSIPEVVKACFPLLPHYP